MTERTHDDATRWGEAATRTGEGWGGDEQPTGELGAAPSRAEVEGDAPVLIAGRYRLGELLGEGGMGRVHRALDLQLQREVAVKLLHPGPGGAAARLLKEARSQARVQHDHVAKVVEVGASDGVPYIAMQLVHGPTLHRAAGALSLEEKVEAVRQAAGAVHAAHLEGLVHRDLKPGNIMLERFPEGGFKAFVVDFGLVRDLDAAAGQSVTVAAGTPHYMAPEQIRGDAGRVDWRTDVYALGATLYEVLTGRPPFAGSSAPAVLLRALEEPARFPREGPRLPRDLQAIVLRCLEKEPQDRYGSARELAEDLGRFLRGEPVQARPVPAVVRLLRAARRHPRLTAAAIATAVVTVTLLGLWVHAVLANQRVAEISRRFGEEVAAMQAISRLAALRPLHDLSQERALIRARMDTLRVEMEDAGTLGRGPGLAALGRGWLALGDPQAARRHLQQAIEAGYRGVEAEASLGEALAEIYRVQVEDARRIPRESQRTLRLDELKRELGDPALEHLRRARSAGSGGGSWGEGLIHLLEGRFDDAIASARNARAQTPWLAESWRLEGDVWLERAEGMVERGEYGVAGDLLARAEEVYVAGISEARSDLGLRQAECHRRLRVLEVAARQEQPFADRLEWMLEACSEALVADPSAAGVLSDIARAHWRVAEAFGREDRDPSVAVEACLEAAGRALEVDEGSVGALNSIGLCQLERMKYKAARGVDPRQAAKIAVDALERAIEADPRMAWSYGNLGNVYHLVASWENSHGEDPRASTDAALQAGERMVELVPNDAIGHYNLGIAYAGRARLEGEWTSQRGASRRHAEEHLRAAVDLRPDLHQPHTALGSLRVEEAEEAERHGEEPSALFNQALESFQRALAIAPDNPFALFNRATAWRGLARARVGRGEDPRSELDASRRDLEVCRRVWPEDAEVAWGLADTALVEAELRLDQGRDPGGLVENALAELDRARTFNSADRAVERLTARAWWLAARHDHSRGRDPFVASERAIAAVNRAIEISPEGMAAHALLGRIWLDRATWSSDRGLQQELAARALQAFERAVELDPGLDRSLAGVVNQAAALAQGLTRPSGSPEGRSPASGS